MSPSSPASYSLMVFTNCRSPPHTHHTNLLDRLHGWWRVFVAAQIDHDPSNVAQEGDGDGGTDEREQGLYHTQTNNIVSALWAITWKTTLALCMSPHWLQVFFNTLMPYVYSELPMMLPRAQTACSHTFWWGEWSSLRKSGTASTQMNQMSFKCEWIPQSVVSLYFRYVMSANIL